jgi:crossover junction endodeoxyribonuclease RusA
VSWILTYPSKPLTVNKERAGNRWDRAAHVKEWREAFAWIAKKERIPKMQWITVSAQPSQKRGRLQDVAACLPSVKAAIDGIVDAGILPDDSGEYVRMVTFLPCLRGDDQLTIIIEGEKAHA